MPDFAVPGFEWTLQIQWVLTKSPSAHADGLVPGHSGSQLLSTPKSSGSQEPLPLSTPGRNKSFEELLLDKIKPRSSGKNKQTRKTLDISAVVITDDEFQQKLLQLRKKKNKKKEAIQRKKEEQEKKKEERERKC